MHIECSGTINTAHVEYQIFMAGDETYLEVEGLAMRTSRGLPMDPQNEYFQNNLYPIFFVSLAH